MDPWHQFFDGPDSESPSSVFSPSASFESLSTAHSNSHDAFFQEYDIANSGDQQMVDAHEADSMMDTDDDLIPNSQSDHEQDFALDHRFCTYNLRPSSLIDGKSVWITWLDTDDSGNYDPNDPGSEERMGRPPRSSTSAARRRRSRSGSVQHSNRYMNENNLDDERKTEPTAAYLSRLAARQQGISITVTLELSSKALQDLARSIPDNWPGEDRNILSDEHYKFLADQLNSRADGWKSYNLRRRVSGASEVSTLSEAKEGAVLPADCIRDPLGEHDDLRNHPVARGCKACRELGFECSLLSDELTWPCVTCVQDDCDCELLTPPEKRRTCEGCKKRRVRCSYSKLDSDPALPCTECHSQSFVCVAGPVQQFIRKRLSYDKDYTAPSARIQDDRKYKACTECRADKKICSLKSKFDHSPCESCADAGVNCTFLPIARKASNSSLRRTAKKKETIPTGAHTIATALNHPVHFLHENKDVCSWCMLNIGVCGRGMRDVLVVMNPDGLSYKEIKGGENASGQNDDYMCIDCTMDRCHILGCSEHELRQIDGIDPELIDAAAMLDRITEGSKPLATDLWCALCPAPALYECCTTQTYNKLGQEITDLHSKEAQGCGLILCEDCAVSYGEFEELERVIEAVSEEDTIWMLGPRADADFLKRDGLLVLNVTAPLEEGADEMEVDNY